MDYVAVAKKFSLDLLDLTIALIKTFISIIWSTYRLIVPAEERSVASDIVLITGAGHGIGKELAKQYGALGAQIVCVDINSDGNQATVNELKKQGIKAYAYTCDVSDRTSVLSLAQKVRDEVGFVTILVNNAGIMPCKLFENHTKEDIARIFNFNVLAQFWTLQAFLPAMISNDYGHVVALSSICGLGGYPNLVPYCASKFAVRGLMEGLITEAREQNQNVKFTTVYPFAVNTGLCKKPRIGFPSLLDVQDPVKVASRIICGQRRGDQEVSAPFFIQLISTIQHLLPDKARNMIDDFTGTGADASD